MRLIRRKKSAQPRNRSYREIEKIRINASALKLGMYVCELDRPWKGVPFPLQGFMIKHPDDIDAVRNYCDSVYIDVERSRVIQEKNTAGSTATNTTHQKVKARIGKPAKKTRARVKKETGFSRNLKKDLKPTTKIYTKIDRLVKSIMSEIRLGKSIDTPAAREAVSACVDNVIHRTDAMLLLTRLRNKDEYTSEHSLNVSILSIAFGLHMGMNRAQLNELGLCGLLHDMGKMLTPNEVLNKPGRLDSKELEVMKRHPLDGREILIASSEVKDSVIDVAYGHHERMNGTGYPQGVPGKQLPLYTRMVSIADTFDAITGERVYRRGETNEVALRILHSSREKYFDSSLVIRFIECVGIYPVGTVVEMHNGEVGIVMQSNPDHRLRPIVKLLLDDEGQLQPPRLVDLAIPDLDHQGYPYQIKSSHNARNFNIDVGEQIRSGLNQYTQ